MDKRAKVAKVSVTIANASCSLCRDMIVDPTRLRVSRQKLNEFKNCADSNDDDDDAPASTLNCVV